VRTTRRRREAILDDFENSGMSGAAYARRHGINYQTFANWIQKRRRSRGDYDNGARLSGTDTPLALALAEVVMKTPSGRAENRPPFGGLRIELAGGANLILSDASQVPLAAELIRQLSESREAGSK
jgi:hypothetical protein